MLKYLQKDDYSSDRLAHYCKNQILLKEIARRWNSKKGKTEIYQYILTQEGLESSEFWAQQLESLLTIDIATKEIEKEKPPVSYRKHRTPSSNIAKPSSKRAGKDYSQFSLDGINYYPKRVFPVEIIRKLIQEHPDYTYHDIVEIFPKSASGNRALLSKAEWQEKGPDAQSRYHTLEDTMKDCNGLVFYVSAEWAIGDFEKKIIPLLDRLGWRWEKK